MDCGQSELKKEKFPSLSAVSFRKRKKNLLKKTFELATLCGIDACIIIFPPRQHGRVVKPTTWPEESDQVGHIISKYQLSDQPKKISHLTEHFLGEKKVVLVNQHIELDKQTHPNKGGCLNNLTKDSLEMYISQLDSKLKAVDEKIGMMEEAQLMREECASMVNDGSKTREEIPDLNYTAEDSEQGANDPLDRSFSQQPVPDADSIYSQQGNNFRGAYHQAYGRMLPISPCFMGTWPVTMPNANNNDNQSGPVPSNNAAPQYVSSPNHPGYYGGTAWTWQPMIYHDPKSGLSHFVPVMQPIYPSLGMGYPLMLRPPSHMSPSQVNKANDNAEE